MATLPLALPRDVPASQSLRAGFAFEATVALFCGLCTVAWLVAPGPFMTFMSSRVPWHGLTLLLEPDSFSWGSFVSALVVTSVWAFFAGSFLAWMRRRLG